MTPLIEGLDGAKKMSKTQGNYIAVDDTPADMFGKTMSIKDDLIIKYFTLLTDVDPGIIENFGAALHNVDAHMDLNDPNHPMQIKKALARAIVTEYHGPAAAKEGEDYFEKVVQRKETPDEMPVRLIQSSAIQAQEMIVKLTGVSVSEARRLITQGALKIDGNKVTEVAAEITITSEEKVVQVGKRKFFKVKSEPS
jgi:tyrosyl-tRNA synthetase